MLPPAIEVLPAEVRDLLGPLQARARAGCLASAQALERVVHLSHLMTLPAPAPLRDAAPGLLEHAVRVAAADDDAGREAAAAALDAGLDAALAAARDALARDLAGLQEHMADVAAHSAAFTPVVAALLAHQGAAGSLAASVARERARVDEALAQAGAHLAGGEPLAAAIEALERARWGARFFPRPRAVVAAPGDAWRPLGDAGAVLEVINTAYYRARGHGIYEDFETQVGADPTLSRADAEDFVRRVEAARAAGRALPDVLAVVETGVGSGQFAQAFLDALERRAPDLHARVRYHLCDVSPAMLEQTLARPGLARHRARLVPVESDGVPDALPGGLRAVCCRFYELFTDLPRTDLVYRDPGGALWRAWARGVVAGDDPIPRQAGDAVPAVEVAAWLGAGDVERLATLAPEGLARLDWEARLEPLDEGDLPAPADDLFFGETDLLLPIPRGGVDALEDALDLLEPDLGWVRLSDYAFVAAAPFHRGLPHLAQVVRRYGGNATLDLHLPLLAGVAAGRGCQVQLTPLSGFVSRVAGGRLVPIPPYYPRYGAANLLRQASGDDAVLPPEALAAFEPLRERALLLDAEVAAAPARAPARARAWTALLAEALEAGWLDPGLPLHDALPDAPLLASLACALDVVVNGVFARAGAGPLRAGRTWWAPAEVDAVLGALVAIGYAPEAASRALEGHADRVRLWTMTVTAGAVTGGS
ncbi:MAG: hypothetical protein M9894_27010 [Planctomycetes bacterium]|nr:hypothetical protein [Planctomycetota bacterium]